MSANRWLVSGNFFTSHKQAQRLFKTRTEATLALISIVILFIWPQFIQVKSSSLLLINEILTMILALIGLNIISGFSGLPNLGHASFIAVGAYSFYSITTLADAAQLPVKNYWPLVVLGSGGLGSLAATFVGMPSLRLKNLYLGMLTIGFQIILDWSIRTQVFFQYGKGVNIERMNWLGEKIDRENHNLFWYYATLMILLLSFLGVHNLLRTGVGRSLVAIRDNERAVESVGIPAGRTKVLSFSLGGFFAGVAGALQAAIFRMIEADTFTLATSIKYISMMVIGGIGSLKGCILGVLAVQALENSLVDGVRFLATKTGYDDAVLTASLRPLLFGAGTLFFLYFQPLGLAYLADQIKHRLSIWPRNS